MTDKVIVNEVQNLYGSIAELIPLAKTRVTVTANAELVMLNWHVGIYVIRLFYKAIELHMVSKSLPIYQFYLLKILDQAGQRNN